MDKEEARRVSGENFLKCHTEFNTFDTILEDMDVVIEQMKKTVQDFRSSIKKIEAKNQNEYSKIEESLNGIEEKGYYSFFQGTDIFRSSDRNFFINSMKVKAEEVKRMVKKMQGIRPWD